MAIALSAGVRTNLLSLQSTASMLTQTQEKLSTGKKVNTALDNPTNFFTAQALTERSSSLTSLQDGINTGVQTVKAANKGLDTISTLLKQLNQQQGASKSSFVVIEHNMDFVMDLCHRIMVMVEGQVMAIGTPAEIRGNKQVLDAYLGN